MLLAEHDDVDAVVETRGDDRSALGQTTLRDVGRVVTEVTVDVDAQLLVRVVEGVRDAHALRDRNPAVLPLKDAARAARVVDLDDVVSRPVDQPADLAATV